jgi:hypothetical protein
MKTQGRIRSRIFLAGAGSLWAIAAVSGMCWLIKFQMTPGQAAAAVQAWPGSGVLEFAPDRPTLLMFVHPECSCSQASLGELQELLTACDNRVAVHLLFFKPTDQSENWSHSDLWNKANAIPGVQVQFDPGGRLAKLFGAKTSGQVMVYSPPRQADIQRRYHRWARPFRG